MGQPKPEETSPYNAFGCMPILLPPAPLFDLSAIIQLLLSPLFSHSFSLVLSFCTISSLFFNPFFNVQISSLLYPLFLLCRTHSSHTWERSNISNTLFNFSLFILSAFNCYQVPYLTINYNFSIPFQHFLSDISKRN